MKLGWPKPEKNDPISTHEFAVLLLLGEGHRQFEVALLIGVSSDDVHQVVQWARVRGNFETNEQLMFEFGRMVESGLENVVLRTGLASLEDPVQQAHDAMIDVGGGGGSNGVVGLDGLDELDEPDEWGDEGVLDPTVFPILRVPVAPLREAFLKNESEHGSGHWAGGRSAGDVARALGWFTHGNPDTSRVRRSLGMVKDARTGKVRVSVSWDLARALADAIGCGVDG